jgi:hypothetical protein
MKQSKIEKSFAKYHATLEPDYRRICAADGVFDPPPIFWVSFHDDAGCMKMAGLVLWDGNDPKFSDPSEFYISKSPDHIVSHPKNIAALVAARVVASLASN